jgi:hypothetical protein
MMNDGDNPVGQPDERRQELVCCRAAFLLTSALHKRQVPGFFRGIIMIFSFPKRI